MSLTKEEKEFIGRNVSFGYATKDDLPSLEENETIPWMAVPTGRTAVWPDSVEEVENLETHIARFAILELKRFCQGQDECIDCPIVRWCDAALPPDMAPCNWPDPAKAVADEVKNE